MTNMNKISFSVLVLLLLFAGKTLALDKYYLLGKGNMARDEGRIEEAIEYYQKYIESHPTTRDAHSAQYHKRIQYYIKNLLIAYSNLLDLYRENRESEAVDKWINKLKGAYLSSRFGSKNMYSLALIYLDNSHLEDGTDIFRRIIKEQKEYYAPFNNKVTLRAFSKLLKIYKSQGEHERLASLLESLKSNYPTPDFDLKDRYNLATLYLRHGLESDGEKLLKEIMDDEGYDPDSSIINTLVKTSLKLLNIYHKKKDKDSIKALFEQISQKYPAENLSPNNMYKIAVTYLKCGKKQEGSSLLVEIADQYSYTTFGRKALFLLGRLSQSNEDWDSAITYYAEYINRYPAPPFFALKAYSRLIDSYWSRDADLELVQNEIKKLSDIVNNISDFETSLTLARDLKWKGMDKLSSATFSLGLSSAREFIAENEDTYLALRAQWIIEKYAYALERYDLVQESANRVLEIADTLTNAPLKPAKKEKIDYIKSQTYLWLAKAYRNSKDYPKAKKFLKMFINNHPNHKEINYARYELGKVYEDENQANEAINMYQMVEDSMWKKKARKRLLKIQNR
jgi:outer membrane protein assembly factor BamD (BamD/ComL family)